MRLRTASRISSGMPHSSHSQPAEEAKVIEERKFWCAMVSACELLLSLLLMVDALLFLVVLFLVFLNGVGNQIMGYP